MNKAFLLTICLLLTSFTGCMGNSEDNDDLTSEIEKLTEENKELNEQLANQTEDNSDLTSDIANLNEQIQTGTEENDALISEIANLAAQIQNLNEQMQNGTVDNSELQSQIENLTAQLEKLKLISFKPTTKSQLKAAFSLWFHDSDLSNHTFGEIETWDVSNITDMSGMFSGAESFNQDISGWDVSSEKEMY